MKFDKKTVIGALVAFSGVAGVAIWQPWDNAPSSSSDLSGGTVSSAQKAETPIFTGADKFEKAAAYIAQNPLGGTRPYADPLKKGGSEIGRPYADPLKKELTADIIEEITSDVTNNTSVDTGNTFAGGSVSSITESFGNYGGGYFAGGGFGGGGYIITPGTPNKPETPVITPNTPAVPEPSTWAMMIVGMGLVGAAMRRGKQGPQQSPTLGL
jgi:hypothetical protein